MVFIYSQCVAIQQHCTDLQSSSLSLDIMSQIYTLYISIYIHVINGERYNTYDTHVMLLLFENDLKQSFFFSSRINGKKCATTDNVLNDFEKLASWMWCISVCFRHYKYEILLLQSSKWRVVLLFLSYLLDGPLFH